jgi:hypothetical protein
MTRRAAGNWLPEARFVFARADTVVSFAATSAYT